MAADAARSGGERVVRWSIAFALLGSAVLVDPAADAAFDAPQRFAAVLGACVGAIALLWSRADASQPWSRPARVAAGAAAALGVWLGLATLASDAPDAAWHGLRGMLPFALLLPLGASSALDGPGGVRLFGVAVAAVGFNIVVSLLQAGGWTLPLPVSHLGGRLPGGALLGNEGYVALASALLGAAAAAVALNTRSVRQRRLALAVLLACCAGIAVNRQATSAMALGAALLVLGALRLRARWPVRIAVLAVLLGAIAAAVPALRAPTFGAAADVATYQRLTTDRLGAWAAALDMARTHPLTGVGPGRFAAQAQTHRFAAEVRLRTRLPPPSTATGFAHAHQEYLQLAAEAGWPALALALLAFAAVWAPLLRLAHSPGAVEPLLLLAVLTAGAVAALAWFPLQIPCTAVLLLLACGRAWRLVARGAEATAAIPAAAARPTIALRVIASLLVLALLWPQAGRYRAEWQIAAASARLEAVLRGQERGSAAIAAVAQAERLARDAAAASDDNRAALLLGIALILQQRGDDASRVLEQAIARGERAELTLNLGRARTVLGDSAGADAAYLRTAWASPLALATLPAAMRADLAARVARLDSELRAGRLQAAPPLR